MKQPNYLYRYCSGERALQILGERRLYLCPPTDFNDLYEGTLARLTQYDRGAALDLVAKIAAIRQDSSPEVERAILEVQMPELELRKTFDDISRWLLDAAEKMRQFSGLTCFSVRPDDQRMWGTYGVNHSGACIEFSDRTGKSEIHRRAQPVLYRNGSLAEKLQEMIQEDLTLDLHRLALWCYFVKSEDWREEREWRVFMLSTSLISKDDRFLEFDAQDVRRVFCGSRMAQSDREQLQRIRSDQGNRWAIIDLKPDIHRGVSEFHGVDVLEGQKDFEYWFPEAFFGQKRDG